MIPADVITRDEFNQQLAAYPEVFGAICSSKAVKDGQKSLEELDRYRYDEAPKVFADKKTKHGVDIDSIKLLVEWKLRHGTFRPTLMSLVSSNTPKLASDTVREAFAAYDKDREAGAALAILTRLKGIGPATASLLLSVHDPAGAVFFSDEAFYWLCCGGKKAPVKYNAKEYQLLFSKARELAERLGVSTTDIEKVAYVAMKRQMGVVAESKAKVDQRAAGKEEGSTKRRPVAEPEELAKESEEPRMKRPRRTKAKA